MQIIFNIQQHLRAFELVRTRDFGHRKSYPKDTGVRFVMQNKVLYRNETKTEYIIGSKQSEKFNENYNTNDYFNNSSLYYDYYDNGKP